jgi:Family of unknown function (DUF6599)
VFRPSKPTRFLTALSLALLAGAQVACNHDDNKESGGGAPPPPPPPSSAAAKVNACAGGGGEVKDPVSAGFFPRQVAGYCIDPNGDVTTYGDQGKLKLENVCDLFDGECEVYFKSGLKREVALRYVDGQGSTNAVVVRLGQYADAPGAYAFFTLRVVAEGDPKNASVKPLAGAGGAAAIGRSIAYMWKGPYLVELIFETEDTKASADQIEAWSRDAFTGIARAIGEKLPGAADLPPAAKILPSEHLIPLGISFYAKDVPGFAGAGQGAVGYYADGDKRYRLVSFVRADADAAKDAMKSIRIQPGAVPVKDLGDEASLVVVQESKDQPKAEYVFARQGANVLGVGDEPLALVATQPLDKQTSRLVKDEKMAKLKAWLDKTPKK